MGASVRNFGMIWPIGQPAGEMREMALRSREIWLDVLAASGLWHRQCGSLHLAYHEDEMGVLEEFVGEAPARGYECSMLSPAAATEMSPVIRTDRLQGAMWSPSELCVFSRQVIADLPTYFCSLGIDFHFGTAVTQVDTGRLLAGGEEYLADRIVVCSGDDFETLFPAEFAAYGMTRSKLQMLRMRSALSGFEIGAHLCAGLTLGHYANFRICERLQGVLERHARELPRHVQFGIHLLVSQHEDGQITVGDSHEYGLGVTPFLSQDIEDLILGYLDTFLKTESLAVSERWYGVYAKHPTRPYVLEQPMRDVTVVTGVGGAGMTLSFGLAERVAASL